MPTPITQANNLIIKIVEHPRYNREYKELIEKNIWNVVISEKELSFLKDLLASMEINFGLAHDIHINHANH